MKSDSIWDGGERHGLRNTWIWSHGHAPVGVPERVCTDKSGGNGQEKQGKEMGDMMGRVNVGGWVYGRL